MTFEVSFSLSCSDGPSRHQWFIADVTFHISASISAEGVMALILALLFYFMIITVFFLFLLTRNTRYLSSVIMQRKNKRLAFLFEEILPLVGRCA